MRLIKKLMSSLLPGAAAAVVVIILSQQFLLNIGHIVRWVCGIARVRESDADLYVRILSQLHDAEIVSPWIPALLIGCGVNMLLAWLIRRGRVRKVVINIALLIPAAAAALWFTTVNGVMLGDMLRQLIPILQSGLL